MHTYVRRYAQPRWDGGGDGCRGVCTIVRTTATPHTRWRWRPRHMYVEAAVEGMAAAAELAMATISPAAAIPPIAFLS